MFWLAVFAFAYGWQIAFLFAALAVFFLSGATLLRKNGWQGLAGAGLSACFLAVGGSAWFWFPLLFPGVAREVAGFYGVLLGAVGCFTGLPRRLSRRVAAIPPRPAVYGEGCRFGMLERYIPLCAVMVSPPYALCKQSGITRVLRAFLSVIFLLGGAGFAFGVFGVFPGLVLPCAFCFWFGLAVLPDGILHGAVFAGMLTAVTGGGYYGFRFALSAMEASFPLSVLLLVLLGSLLCLSLSFLYVRLDRRFSVGAAMREAGAYVVGVPIPHRTEEGFTLRGNAPAVLRRATVTFEPRSERDGVYYFSTKWADLCRFCRRHGFVPVGFRALHDDPEITYYAYTPATERASRAWQRCFRGIRKTEITFAMREDAAHTAFSALLPSLREAVASYHMLFFAGMETSGETYYVRHTLLFQGERQAADFLSSLRKDEFVFAKREEDSGMRDARFCHRVALVERVTVTEGEMNRRAEALIALSEPRGGEYFGWDIMPDFELPADDEARPEDPAMWEKTPGTEQEPDDKKEN